MGFFYIQKYHLCNYWNVMVKTKVKIVLDWLLFAILIVLVKVDLPVWSISSNYYLRASITYFICTFFDGMKMYCTNTSIFTTKKASKKPNIFFSKVTILMPCPELNIPFRLHYVYSPYERVSVQNICFTYSICCAH